MKLTNNLSTKSRMKAYLNKGFDNLQLEQILLGLECNVDVSKYAFPQYPASLMKLLYELMMFDDDFDIDEFSADGTLKIEYLLLHHEDLSSRYRMLTRFHNTVREVILRHAPYYTSYE